MGKKVTSYTNFLDSSSKDRESKRCINKWKCIDSNSIGCLKSLENLLSAKPILGWREVPTWEAKDSDSAKDDACLNNKESDKQGYQLKKKKGEVGLTKLKVAAVTGKKKGEIMT